MNFELDLKAVIEKLDEMMSEGTLKLSDLKAGRDLEDWRLNQFQKMSGFILNMYEKLKETSSDESAYDFMCEIMDSSWRTSIGIMPPRKYKLVECKITCKVAVPENYRDSEIEEVLDSMDLNYWALDTFDTDLSYEDLSRYYFDNDIDDFSDSDWE